ncbi:hypothetical protein PR048_006269 [Dryococelus australis]|uniref:Uncharacterized protein n=1 Tax=Dryococelus australis TaxID=614101 RepID=A0ABQ9IAH8_9NEOP|nr:hypothetical protein PR048_006269 [Dryococelus australis]
MKEASGHLTLTSKNKERDEAMVLQKKFESLIFVLLLVIHYEVLRVPNIVSKSLHNETIELLSAHELLGNALLKIIEIECLKLQIFVNAGEHIKKCEKNHFDELCEDWLQEPESSFRITVFYPMIDTLNI